MIDRLGAAVPYFQRLESFDQTASRRSLASDPGSNNTGTGLHASSAARSSLQTQDGVRSGASSNQSGSATDEKKKSSGGIKSEKDLSDEEKQQVEKLKKRDAEVRAHEQAHAAVGGQFAGAPTYVETTGPDGKRYAIGGEVQIDVAPVGDDAAATIAKMDIVIKAALAPKDPSPQDLSVAQKARQQLAQAQAELQQKELNGDEDEARPNQLSHGNLHVQTDESRSAESANALSILAIQAYNNNLLQIS